MLLAFFQFCQSQIAEPAMQTAAGRLASIDSLSLLAGSELHILLDCMKCPFGLLMLQQPGQH